MSDTDRFRVPLLRGAIAGAVAWVLGYLVTYLVVIDRVQGDWQAELLQFVTDDASDWKIVGWLFYNAHNVEIRMPNVTFGIFTVENQNFVAADDGSLWLLYLVPPVLLLLAGALVAATSEASLRNSSDAAIAGATVAVSYLVLAVGSLFLFGVTVGEDTIRPDTIPAVLLAGVVYPVVLGATGGMALWIASNRDE
ncbi:hypothetical protein [Natronoglomus mannanivorans]|uniref:Transporter n=1 Tax=Natronoglomus mannanivorans TaxID=2979990 RepID=A0AAP3E2I3_9EURY|nr:transporter [Halobacteria archaeon AArc-xg1-1]